MASEGSSRPQSRGSLVSGDSYLTKTTIGGQAGDDSKAKGWRPITVYDAVAGALQVWWSSLAIQFTHLANTRLLSPP